jgi:hypothetical protein
MGFLTPSLIDAISQFVPEAQKKRALANLNKRHSKEATTYEQAFQGLFTVGTSTFAPGRDTMEKVGS